MNRQVFGPDLPNSRIEINVQASLLAHQRNFTEPFGTFRRVMRVSKAGGQGQVIMREQMAACSASS